MSTCVCGCLHEPEIVVGTVLRDKKKQEYTKYTTNTLQTSKCEVQKIIRDETKVFNSILEIVFQV